MASDRRRELAGEVVVRDLGTVIVNRHLVEWITEPGEDAVLFPEAMVRSPLSMNMRKDFTGASPL